MSYSPSLVWPVREPHSGQTMWLSVGQRTLLFWIRSRMSHGWHTFTIDEAARAVGIDRSNVSRGLDRLASLSLIGRRSTRGRGHRTVVWPVSRGRALAERSGRSRWPTVNVAASTSFGGYLSREGLIRAADHPELRRKAAARRLSPPRMLYARCRAGHRVRLGRWKYGDGPDRTALRGTWKGWCRRCAVTVSLQLVIAIVPDPSGGWERAGAVASRTFRSLAPPL